VTDVWITIAVLAVGTAAIRASGPVVLGGRTMPAAFQSVIGLIAPALLAALVVAETLGEPAGGSFELDARIAGVGAAAIALGLRVSTLPVVLLAAVVTALVRLAS
jgi:branched-subunit amino acid transport protein